jgi:hypothetical protein
LLSSVNFCRYLKTIERREEESFEAYRKGAPGLDATIFADRIPSFSSLRFAGRMSDHVSRSAKRIISHSHSNGIAHQISNLDAILSNAGAERYN